MSDPLESLREQFLNLYEDDDPRRRIIENADFTHLDRGEDPGVDGGEPM